MHKTAWNAFFSAMSRLVVLLAFVGVSSPGLSQDSSGHSNYNPAWSPDGSRILLDSNRDGDFEIYSIRVDGSDARRLTYDPGSDLHADWSPDGLRVVFTSNRDGDRDIYLMNADGSQVEQITNDDGHDDMPAWSPEGGEIVFTSDRDGDSEVFLFDLATRDLRQLTHNEVDDVTPVWAPHGRKILFNSQQSLRVVSPRGGASAPFRVEAKGPIWKTSWSRDGHRIAFTEVDAEHQDLDIVVMDLLGGELRRLTSFAGVDRHPSFAPDGERVAFTSTRDGRPDIFIAASEGGEMVRITEGSGER